jgi:alkylation response protein AidB-like acyl-CoA dehydrogenase
VLLSEERRQLQTSVRGRLETKRLDTEPSPDREIRTRRTFLDLAALDLTDIMMPTDFGGSGGGLRDVAVVCSEAGRALLEGPVVSAATVAVIARGCSPSEDLVGLGQGLAAGERIVVISGGMTVVPREGGGPAVLEGTARFVADADVADRLLVVALVPGTDPLVVLVDVDSPGVNISPLGGVGIHQPCQVRFQGIVLTDCDQLGSLVDPTLSFADLESALAVTAAAEATGAAERVMEIAVDYARHRTQFGQSIGSFQATQFRCVDLLIDVEAMRCATARAAEAFDLCQPERHRLAFAAAAFAADGFVRVAAGAHRVLGAIGFSAEGPLNPYTRAAEAARAAGEPRHARRRLADELARSMDEAALSAGGRMQTDSRQIFHTERAHR